MRKRLYQIIGVGKDGDGTNRLSHIYDIFMITTILVSLIPLAIKEDITFFVWTERITTLIFIIDYLLRWATSDFKLKKGATSFLVYPFTFMAIIDLLSILPSFFVINSALKTLKVIRLIRALRILKIFKGFKYSKNITIITNVLKKQKRSLTTVCVLAIGYIFISALIVFNIEPETFNTFFDAVYWATISLTTVGYGDIYAVSTIGKVITMISSVLGIAIVALPAGIITAGYMSEIQESSEDAQDEAITQNENPPCDTEQAEK